MTMHRSQRLAWKSLLLGLAVSLPILVVCGTVIEERPIGVINAMGFASLSFENLPQTGAVSADLVGDGSPEYDLTNTRTSPSYSPPGPVVEGSWPGSETEFNVEIFGNQVSASCRHKLASDLPAGGYSHCDGSALAKTVGLRVADAALPDEKIYVGARQLAAGPGLDGPFSATVEVSCLTGGGGSVVTPIPIDGELHEVVVPTFLNSDGTSDGAECTITGTIDESETDRGGETFHKLQYWFTEALPSCQLNTNCQPGLLCGPLGCQTGDAGNVRTAPSNPSFGIYVHCGPAAPYCNEFNECQVGRPGDPCEADFDCNGGLGSCDGLFCQGAACSASSECPAGEFCTGWGCSDLGALGDTCSFDQDCAVELSCNFGSQTCQ